MEAHYGREKVHYSTRSLAFYYARSCKFVLMSCAHYVALAAGRATDSLVSCQVADLVLSDWALPRMADRLTDDTAAVLFHAIQVHGKIVRRSSTRPSVATTVPSISRAKRSRSS